MRQIRLTTWLGFLVLAGLYGLLIRQLSYHWGTNPQYAYGWSVPLLALFLGWDAWLTRVAPRPATRPQAASFGSAVLAFSLLPASLLFEATPDWRLPLWATAFATVGLLLSATYLIGGRPWLRHFWMPAAFIFLAVPWPVKIEQPAIDRLTDGVTVLTVHGLNLLGTPAVNHGHVIEISTGTVGVEEACSGIRSFQASLMAALFLGQLFGLRWAWRLALIGIGSVVAFLCNAVRAGSLTFIADRDGIPAIQRWHDPAGYTILLVCFAVLTALALLVRPQTKSLPLEATRFSPAPLPEAFVWALAGWLLVLTAGPELWYRSGTEERKPWWGVKWPEAQAEFQELPLASILGAMQADQAKAARWREEGGAGFTMYFFRWRPGPAASRMLARFHRPEVCLPAIGTTLVRESSPEICQTPGGPLRFRSYQFEQQGQRLYVFFCVWEDQDFAASHGEFMESWTPATRWRAVLLKRRKFGQQVLEVGLTGARSEAEARARFRSVIEPLIVAEPPPRGG